MFNNMINKKYNKKFYINKKYLGFFCRYFNIMTDKSKTYLLEYNYTLIVFI